MPAISGQKVVTTAGTALALAPSQQVNCPVLVKALQSNTGLVYVGNDGAKDVTNANGMPLDGAVGDEVYFDFVGDLATLWVDSAVNGDGVAWILLKV